MNRSERGRALFYTRDSGGNHEMTPAEYIDWARKQTEDFMLSFDGTAAVIMEMIKSGKSRQGDVFLDYGVSGNQLSRQGLNLLMAEVAADTNISHVLIPRRDRFARPDNPLDAMAIESKLSRDGVTLVFVDRVVPPVPRGQRQDIADLIVSLVDYHHAGKDRQELARKILFAQMALAKAGYSIGGRPRYGFCRWLVRENGELARQLQDGERVRMSGHHVVWMPLPDDHPSMVVTRRILQMLESMSASRVAKELTAEGVPSPDTGRWRTDSGIRHLVSGVWHQTTVLNIARNPLLLAICTSGRRSMGDQLRHTPKGPRTLEDHDFRADGKPKVVQNPEENRVTAQAHFSGPLVEVSRYQRLQASLNERSGTQRGKPRSKDPDKNPLGSRVFDLNCAWPMYREPYGGKFRYKCGLYTQSHGEKCDHNHVDGQIATRFALSCLVQKLLSSNLTDRFESRVRQLACESDNCSRVEHDLSVKEANLAQLESDLNTAKRNLALAKTEAENRAVAEVFNELMNQKTALEAEIASVKALMKPSRKPEAEVNDAASILGRLQQLVADPSNLAAMGEAFQMVNLRLFLSFKQVHVKNRVLNKVDHGAVTFGLEPSPIPLYAGPTGRRAKNRVPAAAVAASPEGGVPLPGYLVSGREGNSLGNVNRGDRI